MEDKIFTELAQIKKVLTHIIGTSELAPSKQFSIEALNKAAKEFKKLNTLKNGWIKDYDVRKYFPGCVTGVGKFIRDEFEFSYYFTQGGAIYHNKKAIIELSKELKSRNVDLSRYMELRKEQNQLEKNIKAAALRKKSKNKGKSYKLKQGLKDISISDYQFPSKEVVKQDIKDLKKQFHRESLGDFIEVYSDYAMVKFGSQLKKYMVEAAQKKCQTWCNKFNKANYALKLITEHEKKSQSKE